MTKYTTFILLFVISFLAFIMLMGVYLNNIFNVIAASELIEVREGPNAVFRGLFTSPFIISGLVAILSSFAYRIFGIVLVAKNKAAADGEKALWIVGFVIMGFVTAIVFLVMAKGRKFV